MENPFRRLDEEQLQLLSKMSLSGREAFLEGMYAASWLFIEMMHGVEECIVQKTAETLELRIAQISKCLLK